MEIPSKSYLCRYKGADSTIISAILNRCVTKSPYGDSYYSCTDKSWDYTPDGTLRVSDHWNFKSSPRGQVGRKKIHCKTNVPIKNGKWAIGIYSDKKKMYIIEYIGTGIIYNNLEKPFKLKFLNSEVDLLVHPLRERKRLKRDIHITRMIMLRDAYRPKLPVMERKETTLRIGERGYVTYDTFNNISYSNYSLTDSEQPIFKRILRNVRQECKKHETLSWY